MTEETKYIAYCRRSQDREDKQVNSIESQLRELKNYAAKHNLNIVKFITESKSAYKRGREGFNEMAGLLENTDANGILCWHLTRLARNQADGGLIITLMDEGFIKELKTPEKTYGNHPDDKFIMSIHFAMAKKSSDDSSKFVRNNNITKVENGEYPGPAAPGYLNINRHGVIAGKRFCKSKQELLENKNRSLNRIEVDPIDGPRLKKVFQKALTGCYNLDMLRDFSHEIGMRTHRGQKKIAKSTMSRILKNIFYTGRFIYKGKIYSGNYEPLISPEQFEKLQNILANNGRPQKNKREYQYREIVYCDGCEKPLNTDHQKECNYYYCLRAKKRQCSPELPHIYTRESEIDALVSELFGNFAFPNDLIISGIKHLSVVYEEERDDISKQKNDFKRKITRVELKLDYLTSKWLSENNVNSELMSDDAYKDLKMVIEAELKPLKKRLHELEHNKNDWNQKCEALFIKVRNLGETFRRSSFLNKKILMKSLGLKIVRTGENLAVTLAPPFSYFLEMKPKKQKFEPAITLDSVSYSALSDLDSEKWCALWNNVRNFLIENPEFRIDPNDPF